MVTAMTIDASSSIVLLNAIHLSWVGQTNRCARPP